MRLALRLTGFRCRTEVAVITVHSLVQESLADTCIYTVGVMLFHCKSPLLQPSGLAAKNLHHSTLLDASALNLKRKCTDKPGLHGLQRPATCTSRLPQRLWPWFCSELVELCPVFAAFSSSAASSSSMLALSALWFSALVRMSGGTVRETLEDLGSISDTRGNFSEIRLPSL